MNNRVKAIYSNYYNRSEIDWDYYICVNTGINPFQLTKNLWPPTNSTIYKINVDGYPIGAVIERKSKEDYYGRVAMKKKKYIKAINHFNKYLRKDSMNEQVYLYLAHIYYRFKKYNKAYQYIKKCLTLDKDYRASYLKGNLLLRLKKNDQALKAFDEVIHNSKSQYDIQMLANSYLLKAKLYEKNKNYHKAIYSLEKVVSFNSKNKQSLLKLAKLYNLVGNKEKSRESLKRAKKIR